MEYIVRELKQMNITFQNNLIQDKLFNNNVSLVYLL